MNSFSVVLPTYNASKTIRQVLDSITEQSYSPSELIIVDDFSTDDTIEIIRNFISDYQGNININFIQHYKNFGVSKTRNDGIKQSSKNYIAFIDDDDTWETNKLEIINEILKKNPQIKFIGHTYTYPGKQDKYSKSLKRISFLSLLFRNHFATPCVVVSLDQIEFFDEKMRYSEDFDLWLRIACKTSTYKLDYPLTILGRPLLSPGGLSGKRFEMRKGQTKAYLKLVKYKKWIFFLVPVLIIVAFTKYFIKSFIK